MVPVRKAVRKISAGKAAKMAAAAAKLPSSPPSKTPPTEDGDGAGEEKTEHLSRLWLEPDAPCLHCPICFMPFEDEVYMCTNGHAARALCCLRFNRKCASCAEPIGDIRCRPLENAIGEMHTDCKFRKHGCDEAVRYTERRAHEESCPRAPYGCPVDGCAYLEPLDLDLYEHLVVTHAGAVHTISYLQTTTLTVRKREPFRVLVHPSRGRVYLLLNGGDVLGGRSMSLVCLGPPPADGDGAEIGYKMEVRGVEPGALTLAGTVPCARNIEGFHAKKFLFVPDAEWGSSGTVSVSVRIG